VRFRRHALVLVVLLFLSVISAPCFGQNPPPISQIPNPAGPPAASEEPGRERIEKEMAKKANQERQAQLKRDTDRLFKLATELKSSVEKSNENTLSVDVIKKAEEIEKLAHSVKEKMKGN
jgi:hypothetical protein